MSAAGHFANVTRSLDRLARSVIRYALDRSRPLSELMLLWASNVLGRSRVTDDDGVATVCLTSYAPRIHTVHIAIESIARGLEKPRRLILWLDDRQIVENPPGPLRRLARRGLEIQLCDDLGPHKKYYPYVEQHGPAGGPLVTADDDAMYPRWWLRRLVRAYISDPEYLYCYRAHVIQPKDGFFAPYQMWGPCYTTAPSLRHFPTGVSGVLLPPRLMSELHDSGTSFRSCCPMADDVWIHVTAVRAGIGIRQVLPRPCNFPAIPGTPGSALLSQNVGGGGNDRQIAAAYTPKDVRVICASA